MSKQPSAETQSSPNDGHLKRKPQPANNTQNVDVQPSSPLTFDEVRAALRPLPPRSIVEVVFTDGSPEVKAWYGWIYEPRRSKKQGQFWPIEYRIVDADGDLATVESQLPPNRAEVSVYRITSLTSMPNHLTHKEKIPVTAETREKKSKPKPNAPAPTLPATTIQQEPQQQRLVTTNPVHCTNVPRETFDTLVAEWSGDDVMTSLFRKGHYMPCSQ